MLSISSLLNVRNLAIHNVQNNDTILSYVEKCYRYVSKTYHVNLWDLKEKATPHEVVLIFMEDEMKDFTADDIEDLLQTQKKENMPILRPDLVKIGGVAVSDDEWLADQARIAKEADDIKKAKAAEDVVKKTHEAIDALKNSFSGLSKSLGKKDDK